MSNVVLASEGLRLTGQEHDSRATRLSLIKLRLDPTWRANEWNAETLTFTMDVSHPRSVIKQCRVQGCGKTSRSRHGLCAVCRRTFAESASTDLEGWIMTARRVVNQRSVSSRSELCAVSQAGQQCGRLSITGGYCDAHYASHKSAVRHAELTEWTNSVRPLKAKPKCEVHTCEVQSAYAGLCRGHFHRHKTAMPYDREHWLATAEPLVDAAVAWLGALSELVTAEVLYAMQHRDADGSKLDLEPVRATVRLARQTGATSLLELPDELTIGPRLWWARAVHELGVLYTDPVAHSRSDLWDIRVMGLAAGRNKNPPPVDFRVIRQTWLREYAKTWVSTGTISRVDSVRVFVSSMGIMSDAIALGAGADNPSKLGRQDIVRFLSMLAGQDHSPGYNGRILGHIDRFLIHARQEGWLSSTPRSFTITDVDRSLYRRVKKSEAEKDLDQVPEHVIRQLDAHTDLLRSTKGRNVLNVEIGTDLRRLAYTVLRDTGRRVSDMSSMRCNALKRDGDGWVLVYDNVKAKKYARELPILDETAEAIRTVVVKLVLFFPDTPVSKLALFPRATRNHDGTFSVSREVFSYWIETWVNLIPSITNDYPGEKGSADQFDRTRIHPHAFRHSYAQRHADAGVSREVLAELMDHESTDTTAGYYNVSATSRRSAVELISAHRMDRVGNIVGTISAIAYERQSVAAPYGNCQEPSNVAAGGQACPIRFQCAGCTFYRPDPSYLPAIETHIHQLLQNREEALAMGAEEWVVDGFDSQVAAYRHIAMKMKGDVLSLSEDEQRAVEEASAILRRARVMDGHSHPQQAPTPVRLIIGRRPETGI